MEPIAAITTLRSLTASLIENISDRKQAAELREIQKIVSNLDAEYFRMRTEALQLATAQMESKVSWSDRAKAQDAEISRLRAQIAELEKFISNRGKVIKLRELYFDADETGKAQGYPYCVRCYEVDRRLVHINQNPIKRSASTCPQCNAVYSWWGGPAS